MAFVRTVKTTSKTGQSYEYLRIVESYWDKGKRKQRVIANLGNIAVLRKDIKQIVNGLLQKVGEKPLLFADDLKNEADQEYGVGYLASFLWQQLGLEDLIQKILQRKKVELDYANWILMMIVNKLSDPKSKLGIFEWLGRVWWPEHGFEERVLEGKKEVAVAEKDKIAKREVMKFYRALDHLLGMKEKIENHLYGQFRDLFHLGVDLVFYDLTSSYFEGEGPEGLACLGYSRDHEPGKSQVVIGLLVCNGLPIGHEVFAGNRVDQKTVKEILAKLKNQFKIDRCIFVGDRGLVSRENLEILEQYEGFESILALRKRRNKEIKELLGQEPLLYRRIADDLEYQELSGKDGLRYLVCRNPVIASKQRAKRQCDMAEIGQELGKLKAKVDSQKRPSLKKIIKSVEEVLSHRHGHRLYRYQLDKKNRSFQYFKQDEKIKLENELDGVYILRTYEQHLTPEEIIKSYKGLQDVERAFRSMKTPLELRPFFHHKEERVRAHVFICVLAYTILKVVEKMLQDADIKFTGKKTFSLFKQMGIAVMKVGDESYAYVSEPTYMQQKVLKALKIQSPSRIIMNPR